MKPLDKYVKYAPHGFDTGQMLSLFPATQNDTLLVVHTHCLLEFF